MGRSLEQVSTKGLCSDRGKRLHTNVLELKAVSLALKRFKDKYQNQTVLVCFRQLNSSSLHKQTWRNPLGGDVCSPVESHDLEPSLPDNSGCLNVMANLLSRLNQVESTEWSLHPQVFKQICQKWFIPHIDLFANLLNHKVSLYVSLVPDQHRCSEHKLVRSHCLCLPSHSSPLQVIPKPGNAIASSL